jgi:Glycosyl transferase family 11
MGFFAITLIFLFFFRSVDSKQYVTCDFLGQMGNQMWEAAAVLGYALDHGAEPIFPDIKSAINGEVNSQYIFHRLNISPLPPHKEFTVINDVHSHRYTPIPYLENKNVRLRGHFASPKYFETHSHYIREIFGPTPEILQQIHQKYGELLGDTTPTVAIHVRTFIPDGRDPHQNIGGASWGYFIAAMNYFPEDSHFVVFSDAMEWTKHHFPTQGKKVTFIEGNPHYIDFYFMSLCDHFIVSPESTFSWWAAWLNPYQDKIVIVADIWGGISDSDIIPAGWLKLTRTEPFYFIPNTIQKTAFEQVQRPDF